MGLSYKKYLPDTPTYKGGKSKAEIATEDKTVHKLSSNENPLGTSPLAIEAIKKHLSTLSEYPSPIDVRLRNALSDFYQGELTPEQFITANSGVANIELIIRGFLDEQSECIYTSSFFSPYSGFSKKMGVKTIDVPLPKKDFQIDLKAIEKAITKRTSLLFVTSPNNPTGSYIPKTQVEELLSFLPDHVLLAFDEVNYQYTDAKDNTRTLPYVLDNKNVIAINSMSKAYGLAALRVGYSYTTEKITAYLHKFRRLFMINTLSMEVAIAGIHDHEFIQQTVDLVQKEKSFYIKNRIKSV